MGCESEFATRPAIKGLKIELDWASAEATSENGSGVTVSQVLVELGELRDGVDELILEELAGEEGGESGGFIMMDMRLSAELVSEYEECGEKWWWLKTVGEPCSFKGWAGCKTVSNGKAQLCAKKFGS